MLHWVPHILGPGLSPSGVILFKPVSDSGHDVTGKTPTLVKKVRYKHKQRRDNVVIYKESKEKLWQEKTPTAHKSSILEHEWTDQYQYQPKLTSVSALLKDVFKSLHVGHKSNVLSGIAGYYPKSCFRQQSLTRLNVQPLQAKEQTGLHLRPNIIPRSTKHIEKQSSLRFSEYKWKKRQLRWRWNPAERTGTEIVTDSGTNHRPPGVLGRGIDTSITLCGRNKVASKIKNSPVLSKRRQKTPPMLSYTIEGAFLERNWNHQMQSAVFCSSQYRVISEHVGLPVILNQSQCKPINVSSGIERIFLRGECSHIMGSLYTSCPQSRMMSIGTRSGTISRPKRMPIVKSSLEMKGVFVRGNHSPMVESKVTSCSQLKMTEEGLSLPTISITPDVAFYKVDTVFLKTEYTLGLLLLLPTTSTPPSVTMTSISSLLTESLNFDIITQSDEEEVLFLSRIDLGRSFTMRPINVLNSNRGRPQTAAFNTSTENIVEADEVSCRSIYASRAIEENQDDTIESSLDLLISGRGTLDGDTTETIFSIEGLCSTKRTSSVKSDWMFAVPETPYSSEVSLFPSVDTLPIMVETEETCPLRLSRNLYRSLLQPLFLSNKNDDSYAGIVTPEEINQPYRNSELADLEQDKLIPEVVVPELEFSAVQLRLDSSGKAESLGRGSYGAVFLGDLVGENKSVALKASLGTCSDADLFKEARIQLFLKDTGYVAEVFGVVRLDLLCVVQEIVGNGTTLYDLMTSSDNTPSRSTWLSIAYQLACGLSEIHRKGVLHNDLKSDNVIIDTSSENAIVIFIDFGLATYRRGFVFDGILENIAQCYYLAPEVRSGNKSSTKSDIYSLGCLFRDIAIVSDILELIHIADCCTHYDPSCRPILQHLKDDLKDLLDSS